MLFGRRRGSSAPSARVPALRPVEPELYVVAYENMLKGSKLSRRGRPIRQVAVVVDGTVRLVTSGDKVDRRTYNALVEAGVLPSPGAATAAGSAVPAALPDPEVRA